MIRHFIPACLGRYCGLIVVTTLSAASPLRAADGSPTPASPAQGLSPMPSVFRGFDLSKAPHTSDATKLPDLFEERPAGSSSYEFRKGVKSVYSGMDGAVYHLPGKQCFYIQQDPLGSSRLTFYGPFPGDPARILNLTP